MFPEGHGNNRGGGMMDDLVRTIDSLCLPDTACVATLLCVPTKSALIESRQLEGRRRRRRIDFNWLSISG